LVLLESLPLNRKPQVSGVQCVLKASNTPDLLGYRRWVAPLLVLDLFHLSSGVRGGNPFFSSTRQKLLWVALQGVYSTCEFSLDTIKRFCRIVRLGIGGIGYSSTWMVLTRCMASNFPQPATHNCHSRTTMLSITD
jgi:hypothetical protein